MVTAKTSVRTTNDAATANGTRCREIVLRSTYHWLSRLALIGAPAR